MCGSREQGVWRTLFGEGGGRPAVLKAFQQGPHVIPSRAPLQTGVLAVSLLPAFGLLVAIWRPCTSWSGTCIGSMKCEATHIARSAKRSCPGLSHVEKCAEERNDATSWDQLGKLSTMFFCGDRERTFPVLGAPRPNINPRVGRLYELNN